MGLDKEVFTDYSSRLDNAYEANIAARYMYSLALAETNKALGLAEGADRQAATQRATILTIAYKLAVKHRDDLVLLYAKSITPPPLEDAPRD